MKKLIMIALLTITSTACTSYNTEDGRRFVQGTYPGLEIVSGPGIGNNRDGDTYVLCNKETGEVTIVALRTRGTSDEPYRTTQRELEKDKLIICGKPAKDPASQAQLITSIKQVVNGDDTTGAPSDRFYTIKDRLEKADKR